MGRFHWVLLLWLGLGVGFLAPAARADAYGDALAAAAQKYAGPDGVPEASVRWLAKTYRRPAEAVRDDLRALGSEAVDAPPGGTATPPPAAPEASAPAADLELPFEVEGVDPMAIAAARGLVSVLFAACAIFLWAAPRSMKQARSHVREASGCTAFAPRLLALYLVVVSAWELGGVFLPQRFAFGRPLTIWKELAPPVKRWVARQPLWQVLRKQVKTKTGY